jgi:hypothetical protein
MVIRGVGLRGDMVAVPIANNSTLPAVFVLDELDSDDAVGGQLGGFVLHPGHRELSRVVHGLCGERQLDVGRARTVDYTPPR